MKRKEKAAVDEFVALVGGKTWEPVRHKCMGKWSGMTDYGFVIDGRITLFVSNSMAYFKKRIREWIKSIHTFEAKKDCYLRLLREQIEKDNDKAKDEKLNPVRLIDIGILSPESNSPFDFFTPYVLVEINGRRFKHQTAELSCAIMVDSLAGYLEECNCKDIYTASCRYMEDSYLLHLKNATARIYTRQGQCVHLTTFFAVCGLTPVIICIRLESRD